MPVASCHSFLFRLLQPINLSSIKAALGLYKDCWVLFMLPRLPVKSGTNILREKAPWTMDSIDLGENGLAEHTIYLQLKGDKTSPLDLNARHMQSNLHQLYCSPSRAIQCSFLVQDKQKKLCFHIVFVIKSCRSGTNPTAFRIFRPASGEAPRSITQ